MAGTPSGVKFSIAREGTILMQMPLSRLSVSGEEEKTAKNSSNTG